MRIAAAIAVAFGVTLTASWAEEPQGCPRPDTLGVSRVLTVDPKGGPWFGTPHGDHDVLQQGEVVLTFDDGPAPQTTRPILAALAAQCTKATFFMVGEMAAEYPDVVHEVAEQGHTIGTHTWSHRNLGRLGEEQAKGQIERAFTAVEKAAGTKIAPFFRYPYLSESKTAIAYLQGRNVAQFAIDIDSFDWRTRSPQAVVRRVMAGLAHEGRGIILMHDIHTSTASAVPELLRQLQAKGYKVVHLQTTTPAEILPGFEQPTKEVKEAHVRSPHRGRYRTRGAASPKWMLW
jgi:peptidoglycan/xylan/chitin deacetylase (PgdA/CDA1 family)